METDRCTKSKGWAMLILLAMVLSMVLMTAFPSHAYEYSIAFEWDASSPTPEGYLLYSKSSPEATYVSPSWTGNALRTPNLNFTCEEGQVCTTYHVARAFIGPEQSGNSNEISYTFDAVRLPAPTDFEAEYSRANKQISFRWTQLDQARTDHWVFFMKDLDVAGSTYKEIAKLPATGAPVSTELTTPLDLPQKLNRLSFVAVAFNKSKVWSFDSIPVELEVNLQSPTPVNTLRINVVTSETHPYQK